MKYNIQNADKYSFATIISPKSQTASALITVDIHNIRTAKGQIAEHIYSDALLSGCGKYTREDFLDAVNTLGASIGVNISNSVLTISLKSRTENFTKLLKLAETMLTSPNFSKSELTRIKRTTISELHEAKEDSKSASLSGLRNSFYGNKDRKYSFEIDQLATEVPKTKVSDFKKLHSTVLSQAWTCSIAANKDDIENLNKLVAKLKKNVKAKVQVKTHEQKTSNHKVVLKNIPSRANIDFGIGSPIPITLHHPDYIPLSFAIAVLGKWGGFSGRLMSTVRELEGLTYGIYGHLEGFSGQEQGYFRIMTFFAPDKTMQGITSTFREITNIYEKGITKVELEKFKKITNTGQILLRDSIGGQLSDLHSYHCHGFTLKEMEGYKAKVELLTLKEVNDAIKKYLDPANLTISGAGPTKAVQKDLDKFIKSV
jgi:zinc protease